MVSETMVIIGSGNDIAWPLATLMIIYCQLESQTQSSAKFESNASNAVRKMASISFGPHYVDLLRPVKLKGDSSTQAVLKRGQAYHKNSPAHLGFTVPHMSLVGKRVGEELPDSSQLINWYC